MAIGDIFYRGHRPRIGDIGEDIVVPLQLSPGLTSGIRTMNFQNDDWPVVLNGFVHPPEHSSLGVLNIHQYHIRNRPAFMDVGIKTFTGNLNDEARFNVWKIYKATLRIAQSQRKLFVTVGIVQRASLDANPVMDPI